MSVPWLKSYKLEGDFGLIMKPEQWPRSALLQAAQLRSSIDWLDTVVPTYNQQLPSCVGHATANWIECMLRRTHGASILSRGQQIDGDMIYARGREMFFAERTDGGGLQLRQGFDAAIDLGILPPDSVVHSIPPDLASMRDALDTSPLVQGHVVSKDWQYASFDNGALPGRTKANILEGAHATCLIGLWDREGNVMLPFLNSWGAGWGWNGIGQMTWGQWQDGIRWMINPEDDIMRGDGPYTADLGPTWKDWIGWRKAVIKV